MNSLSILLVVGFQQPQQVAKYDPLICEDQVEIADTQFSYGEQKRIVPLRIYAPVNEAAAPVILFSHGLGGSREGSRYLGNHWAGRGYVVVCMQHAGSDRDVMNDVPRLKKLAALKAAASVESARDRYADVKATIDHLEYLNQPGGRYESRFKMGRIGMSGHSFGALTTQAVSGQNYGTQGQVFTDARIKAAVAFSPSPPAHGNQIDTFSKVKIPWLLMTGTQDRSPIGNRTDPKSRRLVFQQLPPAGKFYELVFEGGKHSAFSDGTFGRKQSRNPKHHPAIQAVSSAFWDAHLKADARATEWLNGIHPRQLLDKADIWQKK